MHGAVALDFGASSARFAAGVLDHDRILFDVIEQIPHCPVETKGRAEWQIHLLLDFCQQAAAYASQRFSTSTLGIDAWGVDHGFVSSEGKLLGAPVAYRDHSHVEAFERLRPFRAELYQLTGIQHQPFNTSMQLSARALDEPSWVGADWFLLPDLMAFLLTGERHQDLTEASTTQLMGIDGLWSNRAFEIVGWPTPQIQPTKPGSLGRTMEGSVTLAHVGSHDTASAVCGLGRIQADQIFLNVGTWSLIGAILDKPLATRDAEASNFTNEWTVDGRVRFLKNVPGFFILNRLHQELGVSASMGEWLAESDQPAPALFDVMHESLFNPTSMVESCCKLMEVDPGSLSAWASCALQSLCHTLAQQPRALGTLLNREIRSIRVGGGGSNSAAFCQCLANMTGLPIIAGPAEATVLGNLAVQFLASGKLASWDEVWECVAGSTSTRTYEPN